MNNGIQPTVELATNNGSYPYPVYPMMNGGGFNNSGFLGGDGWIILLLILAFSGNWGNGNGGFFGGNNFDNGYAWLSNGQKEIMQNTNNGFDTLHISNQLEGNRDAINNLSTALCNGFNNTNTSLLNGFNSLNTSFLNCCCENKLGIADLKYTVATENCQDRQALNEGVRDIIASQVAGTQRVLDKLCQLELDNVKTQVDAKNDRIADLQRELSMKDLQASQIAQNSFIAQGFANEVDQLYNRLSNCPVPSTPVYGRTPIFTCPNNNGCGCNGYNNLI